MELIKSTFFRGHKPFILFSVTGAAWVVFLFSILYINETSYESHFTNSEHIYRVSTKVTLTDRDDYLSSKTAYPVAALIRSKLGENAQVTVVQSKVVSLKGQKESKTLRLLFADENLGEVLPFKGLKPFVKNNSLVLTHHAYEKFNQFPLETFNLTLGEHTRQFTADYQIPALPEQTHFQFDGIAFDSWVQQQWRNASPGNYRKFDVQVYIALKTPEAFQNARAALDNLQGQLAASGNPKAVFEFELYPISDIHLKHTKRDDVKEPGDIGAIQKYLISIIVITLLAAVNLSQSLYSRLIEDSHKFGIKSALGASKAHMLWDLLREYFPLLLVASLLGFGIALMSMNWFKHLVDVNLSLSVSVLAQVGFLLIVVPLVIFLLAAAFPLFMLFRSSPAKLLRAKLNSRLSSWLTLSLSLMQAVAIISLMSLAIIASKQFTYGYNEGLGFSPKRLLIIWGDLALPSRFNAFEQKLIDEGLVESAATSFFVPGGSTDYRTRTRLLGGREAENVNVSAYAVSHDFFNTLKAKLIAGKTFRQASSLEAKRPQPNANRAYHNEVVINEAAVKTLGLNSPEQAIGMTLTSPWARDSFAKARIVGVVENMRFRSVFSPLEPTVYFSGPKAFRRILLRPASGVSDSQLLRAVREYYPKRFGGIELQYNWMNAQLKQINSETRRQATVFSMFSIAASTLVFLGLVGSALQTAVTKSRELAIRQALGGPFWPSILRISGAQIIPLLLGGLLAIPLASYLSSLWLSQFAQKLEFSHLITLIVATGFILVGASVFLTIIAIKNCRLPLHTLRDE